LYLMKTSRCSIMARPV